MPYIPADRRPRFDPHLEQAAAQIETEGDLNYCITKLAALFLERVGTNYANLALCASAMEHAKLEWYRRRTAPYEDKKILENGDV
ncbi:MAG: hypothetical protein AB1916_07515 [Thermodesulfobacteriota bacterium]